MSSLLKYRFPGREVVTKTGFFERVDSNSTPSGFIISDFEGKCLYQFIEGSEEVKLHFSHELPNCVSKEEYLRIAQVFLNEIRENEMGKAVFSRVKRVPFDTDHILELFELLAAKYPETLVYLVSSEHFGTWIGASPEKLIESKNDLFYTMSLAGTLPVSGDQNWTTKEKDEQQQVTDFILDKIQKFGVEHIHLNGPNEVFAGAVKHLRTEIKFNLEQLKSFELANDLHPTPAVSGMPRDKALDLIKLHEKHTRDLYAGMIGFIDSKECTLYVNLRCCQVVEKSAFLYVGGGFTKDSDIEQEWCETENKSRTLLNLIEQIRN